MLDIAVAICDISKVYPLRALTLVQATSYFIRELSLARIGGYPHVKLGKKICM